MIGPTIAPITPERAPTRTTIHSGSVGFTTLRVVSGRDAPRKRAMACRDVDRGGSGRGLCVLGASRADETAFGRGSARGPTGGPRPRGRTHSIAKSRVRSWEPLGSRPLHSALGALAGCRHKLRAELSRRSSTETSGTYSLIVGRPPQVAKSAATITNRSVSELLQPGHRAIRSVRRGELIFIGSQLYARPHRPHDPLANVGTCSRS